MEWCNKVWQLLIITPALFGENDNNLKMAHFAPVTHYDPGDSIEEIASGFSRG